MKKTILIAAMACLSMVAVAQSDKKTEPAAATEKRGISSPMGGGADRTTSPRDAASGQASGKVATSTEIKSPRDIASGQATGRQAAASSATGTSATGQANAKTNVHASAQPATVQSPKEVSTGKATGGISAHDDWEAPKARTTAPVKPAPSSNPQEQRMHKPVTVSK